MKPRIGIPIPTTIDLPYSQRSWPAYATGVERAGGEPVEIPLTLSSADREALSATCHGFLLPGSPADVDPSLYDTPHIPECGPQDEAREQTDFALLTHAAASGKPLLGICFGTQSMNVFHGGSLIQDLSPLPVNHSAGGSVAIAHSVVITPGSLLAEILLSTQSETNPSRLPVNTSHHQSVAVVGQGLRIVARCPDDEVIEAVELDPMFHVEHPGRFLLGVQWHPERSLDISPASRALFHHLVAQAALFTQRLSF
jgi:putative glutamine amidotransferase